MFNRRRRGRLLQRQLAVRATSPVKHRSIQEKILPHSLFGISHSKWRAVAPNVALPKWSDLTSQLGALGQEEEQSSARDGSLPSVLIGFLFAIERLNNEETQ